MNYNSLPAQQKKFVKIRVLNIHYLKIIADQNQKKIGIESFENPLIKALIQDHLLFYYGFEKKKWQNFY
jgi:hypothetical protein